MVCGTSPAAKVVPHLHFSGAPSPGSAMSGPLIVVAGATGNLGGRIARALVDSGASLRAIVRADSDANAVRGLREQGVAIAVADFRNRSSLAEACADATCVVSALSGLRDVIVDAQAALLDAAVDARVPRFIPSDFCLDFNGLEPGGNRNLDLRREFAQRLGRTPIAATSILNGAFADMLTGQAPIILFKRKRVLYWRSADQLMDFTTRDDTAAFTAAAALDAATPRWLRVVGDEVSARGLARIASAVTGDDFKLRKAGPLGLLRAMIGVARVVAPQKDELYPAWQGMQYLHDMFSGKGKLHPLDNTRYRGIRWTTVADVLEHHVTGSPITSPGPA
jgi:uncharacterized protein YbjT (DUF2867 family)